MSELASTLRALLSNDNTARSAAEKIFQDAKQQQPAVTVAALFSSLAEVQLEEPVREQAAVLLRQALGKVKNEGSTWSHLGEGAQGECKAKVLQLLEQEQQAKVRRKIADIVQSLGNQLIDIGEDERPNNAQSWPELMPFLMRVVVDTSRAEGLRADALWAVKELLPSTWQIMVANGQQTLQVLKTCFEAPAATVRGHAAQLLCELVENVEKKEDRAPFSILAPDMCGVLKQLADVEDNTLVNQLLQSMQGTSPSVDFLKDCIGSHLLPVLAVLAKSHREEETQRLALEVLVSLAEGKAKLLAKVPGYVQQVLEICVNFLIKLDDDIASWSEEDDESAEDEEQFTFGKEVVDRLCRCMNSCEKFPMVMDLLKPAIASLFQSGNWKQTVVGLTILNQIAEYVDDETSVIQMVGVVRAQLRNASPRVRHAAWSAVAQFSEDHAEIVVSETMTSEILQEFTDAMDDPCLRVQSRSMEAFQLYGSAVERELLDPFVQHMMEKLGQKLQSAPLPIQRKAITFIAVLAGQMEDGFAAYYGPLMPIFKQLIQKYAHNPEERVLLGKAFECVSLLAAAVGTAVFASDAEVIMQAMIQATQVPNLPSNDPVKEYMLQASQRICATMKGNFVPFVPHILPGILEKFTLAPKEYNPETAQSLGADEEVNLTLTQENGQIKVMIMSTSELEDLQNALGCVHTLVEELGKSYSPFVGQTAQALLPVFDFSMDEEIRDIAFETWGLLCQAAREGGQVDVVTQLVHEFLNRILPKLEAAASSEPDSAAAADSEALKTAADGVKACLEKAGPNVLSADQVKQVHQVALETLNVSLKRRQTVEEGKKQTPDDPDDNPDDDDEDDDGIKLRIACVEMAGALMQHHADVYASTCLPLCMQLVAQFIQPTVKWEDHRLALFVVCDMLLHLRERVTSHWPQFLPQLLQDVTHQMPALRQPACYGTSLAAREPAFASFAQEAAKSLSEVVSQTRSAKKKSDKPAQACADNALTALVQILRSHPETIQAAAPQLWGVWLQGLPCQADEEEGVKNSRILLELVVGEHPQVVGEGGANLPKVLSVLVDVYKTGMADDETSRGIGQLVVKLGTQRLEQLAGQLKEKQKKKLLRIHREAESSGAGIASAIAGAVASAG